MINGMSEIKVTFHII